jgi:hypothetical protein
MDNSEVTIISFQEFQQMQNGNSDAYAVIEAIKAGQKYAVLIDNEKYWLSVDEEDGLTLNEDEE